MTSDKVDEQEILNLLDDRFPDEKIQFLFAELIIRHKNLSKCSPKNRMTKILRLIYGNEHESKKIYDKLHKYSHLFIIEDCIKDYHVNIQEACRRFACYQITGDFYNDDIISTYNSLSEGERLRVERETRKLRNQYDNHIEFIKINYDFFNENFSTKIECYDESLCHPDYNAASGETGSADQLKKISLWIERNKSAFR